MRTTGRLVFLAAALLGAGNLEAATPQSPVAKQLPLTLARLDCGGLKVADFDSYFSDSFDYPKGPRQVVVSCYLIRWGDKVMLWDTGLPTSYKGRLVDRGDAIYSLRLTVADQLAMLGLKPSDVDVVAISHRHGDHSGEAADFPSARLVVGKRDFEDSAGPNDPFKPWRGEGKNVTLATGDVDIFGDGRVVALWTPGHTPGHLSLLVQLHSGTVMLSGDLYHAAISRATRGLPSFNASRADTLASMDRFERIARHFHARVIIGHEPADVSKLPPFPAVAR